MAAIEPNWISLIWFAAFATICMVAFLTVAGMFPLGSRPEAARSGAATLLVVVGNGDFAARRRFWSGPDFTAMPNSDGARWSS